MPNLIPASDTIQFYSEVIGTSEYRRALDIFITETLPHRLSICVSEEDVRKEFERSLEHLLVDLGILKPGGPQIFHSEVLISIKRPGNNQTVQGRLDSQYRNILIEYKKPGRLTNRRAREEATRQLAEDYLLSSEYANRSCFGFLTDGKNLDCFTTDGGIVKKIDSLSGPISVRSIDFFIRSLTNHDLREITPVSISEDFALLDSSTPTYALFRSILALKRKSTSRRTRLLFSEWEKLFKLSESDSGKHEDIVARRAVLSEISEKTISRSSDEYDVLFAMQTTYSILLKLFAVRISHELDIEGIAMPFSAAIQRLETPEETRAFMSRVERGDFYRQMGVLNMVDGDFFSWYVGEEWNTSIPKSLRHIFARLSSYERLPISSLYRQQDLFRDLYENSIPKAIRHSFGEYYTPYWLAESVIETTIGQDKREFSILDPTCGSGTFVLAAISKVLTSLPSDATDRDRLDAVLSRVKGIDLNPLAVLGSRINYFMNISAFFDRNHDIELPIYLGDASYVPERVIEDGTLCVSYDFFTDVNEGEDFISMCLPESLIRDATFPFIVDELENLILAKDRKRAVALLERRSNPDDLNDMVRQHFVHLVNVLVDLEDRELNSIWLRIFGNYLKTAVIGPFDYVVGNPPWVDWKVLPEKYRDKLKGRLASSGLFSRDVNVGGVDLNICALIANRAAEHFLADTGTLSMLMPKSVMFNKSYEGFRNFSLTDGTRLYLQRVGDWSEAGHPFNPVTEPFCNFVFARDEVDYWKGIPVTVYKKQARGSLPPSYRTWEEISNTFKPIPKVASIIAAAENNALNITETTEDIDLLRAVIGENQYRFRKGVGATPAAAYRLQYHSDVDDRTARFTLYEKSGKRMALSDRTVVLEKAYVRPLIMAPDIKTNGCSWSNTYIAFPYSHGSRQPLSQERLREEAPLLLRFLQSNSSIIQAQSKYNERVQNTSEFYGLIRIGTYSYGSYFSCMRDNTKVIGTVIGKVLTHWGAEVIPILDGHISYISEVGSRYIDYDEALYVANILNLPLVKQYIESSSSLRGIGTSFDVKIPIYDAENQHQAKFVDLAKILVAIGLDSSPAAELHRKDIQIGMWEAYQSF